MKFVHVVVLFIVGTVMTLVGAYLATQGKPGASTLLTLGNVTHLIGGVALIVMVLRLPEVRKIFRGKD